MAIGNLSTRQLAIFAIKQDASDQYVVGANFATSATSATDITDSIITFTPPTAGDYLIFAKAIVNKDTTASRANIHLSVTQDAVETLYSATGMLMNNVSDRRNYSAMVKVALTTSSCVVKLQAWSTTSGTVNVTSFQIVCMRWDKFQNAYYAESRGTSSTSSNSFQDKVTLTQVSQYGPYQHAVFYAGITGRSVGAGQPSSQGIQDATTQQEQKASPIGTLANDAYPFLCIGGPSLAAVSTVWKTQYKSNAANTVSIKESAIALLQTGGASVEIKGGTILGATIK